MATNDDTELMMGLSGISMTQLLIVLLIALMVFGSKRLKNVGGDLGHAIRSFRTAVSKPDAADDVTDTD